MAWYSWTMDEVKAYKYEGLPLTPAVFAEAARQIFPDSTASRKDVIEEVMRFHCDNGGVTGKGEIVATAKKALQTMEKSGEVEKTGAYGFWRFGDGNAKTQQSGNGRQLRPAVYVYYYPAYRSLAKINGADFWPHKIGMTRVDAEGRIKEQIGTALPEAPVITIFDQVANPDQIEKAVHAILVTRGKSVKYSPGSEWFDTNLEEVDGIINFLSGGGS